MIRVASVDLCIELYRLTGWGKSDIKTMEIWAVGENGEALALVNQGSFDLGKFKEFVPAYDTDFLLDKMTEVKTGLCLYHVHSTMNWECFYAGKFFEYGTNEQHWETQASTPADAACKFAIQLVKEGVINAKNS